MNKKTIFVTFIVSLIVFLCSINVLYANKPKSLHRPFESSIIPSRVTYFSPRENSNTLHKFESSYTYTSEDQYLDEEEKKLEDEINLLDALYKSRFSLDIADIDPMFLSLFFLFKTEALIINERIKLNISHKRRQLLQDSGIIDPTPQQMKNNKGTQENESYVFKPMWDIAEIFHSEDDKNKKTDKSKILLKRLNKTNTPPSKKETSAQLKNDDLQKDKK